MRQPDIEIYLKDADVDHKAIAAWLGAALGPCTDWVQKGQTYKCKAGSVPVTWLPKAVGKWNSLYLESDQTPWDDDIACARAMGANSLAVATGRHVLSELAAHRPTALLPDLVDAAAFWRIIESRP